VSNIGQTPDGASVYTWGRPLTIQPSTDLLQPGPVATPFDAVLRAPGRLSLERTSGVGTVVTATQYRGAVEVVRTIVVPDQGIVIPVGSGRLRVAAVQPAGVVVPAQLLAGVAYGAPTVEWIPEPDVVIAPGASVVLVPPPWSRRLSVAILGNASPGIDVLTVPAWPFPFPVVAILSANKETFTANPLGTGAVLSISWELVT